jgi:hypothetical protein
MRKTERRTCLGTGAIGIGATARQAWLITSADTLTGRTTPVPRTALEIADANVGLD